MKVAKYMGHAIVIVLCCILTVLAETLETRNLKKQHIKHLTQQQQTQPQQQQHQHKQRQHFKRLRQQLLPNTATVTTARQSSKFDWKSPPIDGQQHDQQQENPNSEVEFIENTKNSIVKKNTTAPVTSTKLRRLSAKDYYNRSMQRRYNIRRSARDEWAYNTYNIHTNTFGPTQTQSHAGKGDDNSDDVEFVSNTGVKSLPDWSRRGYVPSLLPTSAPTRKTTTTTQGPPAMVPARRGYPMVPQDTTTTEDPFESNVISRHPSSMYSKDMEK